MTDITHDPAALRDLLASARVIAVVGHSDKPTRTSYQIARFLRLVGYTVYPVNPTVAQIDGAISYPSLAAVPEPIDIVDVFRRSEHLLGVVEDAIAAQAGAVWAQLGVADSAAAARAQAAEMPIVVNTCIKVAYNQLIG
ncbi:MAG: CoA-binding protein [Chloroflexi bacterium]|nr:CoA-binding protein [Chloroflexota bacterium]